MGRFYRNHLRAPRANSHDPPMNTLIIALTVAAAAGPVNLDQGVSVRALVEPVHQLAAMQPTRRIERWIADSKKVELQPGQRTSAALKLSSTPIVQNCTVDRWGEHCREDFGTPYRVNVRLVIN